MGATFSAPELTLGSNLFKGKLIARGFDGAVYTVNDCGGSGTRPSAVLKVFTWREGHKSKELLELLEQRASQEVDILRKLGMLWAFKSDVEGRPLWALTNKHPGRCLAMLLGEWPTQKFVNFMQGQGFMARVVNTTGDGLWHLHKFGVMHRDLTLSNVVTDSSGNSKIVDYSASYKADAGMILSLAEEGSTPPEFVLKKHKSGDRQECYAYSALVAVVLWFGLRCLHGSKQRDYLWFEGREESLNENIPQMEWMLTLLIWAQDIHPDNRPSCRQFQQKMMLLLPGPWQTETAGARETGTGCIRHLMVDRKASYESYGKKYIQWEVARCSLRSPSLVRDAVNQKRLLLEIFRVRLSTTLKDELCQDDLAKWLLTLGCRSYTALLKPNQWQEDDNLVSEVLEGIDQAKQRLTQSVFGVPAQSAAKRTCFEASDQGRNEELINGPRASDGSPKWKLLVRKLGMTLGCTR